MAYSKFKQGFFHPLNPSKYKGNGAIIYRSGLELKYMRFLDNNSNVLEWSSEKAVIPYLKPELDPRKNPGIHRYYVDFTVKLKTNQGVQKYLVEVKPFTQTQPPKPSGNRKPSTILHEQYTFAVNSSKWTSARKWCEANGYKFQIVTEKDLPS